MLETGNQGKNAESRRALDSDIEHDFVWRMSKALIILAAFGGVYVALLSSNLSLLLAAAAVMFLALLNYAIVACIGHDAVHGVFSRSKLLNEIALFTLDFSGVNGLLWRARHMNHHRETNDVARDPDIRGMPWIRMTPDDRLLPHHRLQAFFIPVIYALTIVKVQVFDEIGFVGEAPKRKRVGLAIRSIVGKVVFIFWAIVLPITVYGTAAVPFIILGYCTLSMLISVIFQVAHNVPGVTHVDKSISESGREQWRRQQIAATTNFRVGPLFNFFVGGLDRQIEHHLFPHLPHTCLASKAGETKEICENLSVEYKNAKSLFHAFVSHLVYLHQMGKTKAPKWN
jgi:linoleoyl-CoA desaturase